MADYLNFAMLIDGPHHIILEPGLDDRRQEIVWRMWKVFELQGNLRIQIVFA